MHRRQKKYHELQSVTRFRGQKRRDFLIPGCTVQPSFLFGTFGTFGGEPKNLVWEKAHAGKRIWSTSTAGLLLRKSLIFYIVNLRPEIKSMATNYMPEVVSDLS